MKRELIMLLMIIHVQIWSLVNRNYSKYIIEFLVLQQVFLIYHTFLRILEQRSAKYHLGHVYINLWDVMILMMQATNI